MSQTPRAMPNGLIWTFRILDWSMILYWAIISLGALAIVSLPASFMYDGYGTPIIDAWNWSFAPLDILFAILGLFAIKQSQKQDPRWPLFAMASLCLTFCAGLMAVGFWAIRGEFNLSWWLPNLILMLVPLYWVTKLLRAAADDGPST